MLKTNIGSLEPDQEVYTRERGKEGTVTVQVKYQINMTDNI